MTKTIYDPLYQKLIDYLRLRRRELGLRQADVAHRLGRSRTWVGKVEQRERRLDVVEMRELCELYDLDICEVVRRFANEESP